MANLGTLSIDMLVNLTGFRRGLQQAEQQTEQTTNNMSNAFNDFRQSVANSLSNTAIGSWASDLQTQFAGVNGSALTLSATLSGMAVGGAFVAFGAMSRLAIETANANMEIQKFANLANSSVITFQGLAGASELLGINQDKLADQLKDFNEKLGEFASVGSGGAKDFFEQIAVKTEKGAEGSKKLAKEMSKMNGVEALQKYVDVLEQAGVNQQQMSFYLESMGSDLTALIPILKDGGKLWKDYQTALEEAGVITSEQAIEKSALLQAQTKSLQLQYGALKSTLAEQMMPVLSNTISHFTTGSKQGGQFTGILTGLTAVAKGVAVVMVGLNTAIEVVIRSIRLAVENFAEVGITARNVFNAMINQDFAGMTSAIAQGFGNMKTNTISMGSDIYSTASRAMQSFGDILSDNTAKADKLAQSIHSISQATQNSVKQNQGGFTAGIAQNKALNETPKKTAEKVAKQATARLNSDIEKAILWGASQLQIDPNYLASVISFETGGTFSTNARHPKTSATGLIQFMEDADGKYDGKYYGMTRNQFGALSAMEQMQYVVKFFKGKGLKANASLGQVYDAVTGTGYRNIPKYNKKGERIDAYYLNRVWDANKDGYIAPGESVTSGAFKQHMKNWFPNGSDSLKIGEALNDIAKQEYKQEQDYLKQMEETAKARGEIIKKYMTEPEKVYAEHLQNLKEIEKRFTPLGHEDAQSIQELALLKQRYIDVEMQRYNAIQAKFNADNAKLDIEYKELWLQANRHLFNEEEIINLEYVIELKKVDLLDENEQFKQARKDILSHEANKRMQEIQNEKAVKENAERENTWSKYQERFATAENPYLNDLKLLQETRQQMLITEQEYHNQRLKLQTQTGLAVGQAFASSLAGLVDESSSAYSALFAIQKAFSVASVLMSSTEAISKAWASAPFPYNLPAVATATVQTGALQAIISAISPVGMAHNGMTNIPKEGTWLLDGGERVLNPKQNQDLTRYLQERSKRTEPQNNNAVSNNIKIVNSFDESMLVDAMNSRRGEQIILNVIKRNKSALGF